MEEKEPKKKLSNYAKYTGLGLQMVAIILVGVFGGYKLDEYFELGFPVFTIILSLASVVLAIYYSVKDFIKMKK